MIVNFLIAPTNASAVDNSLSWEDKIDASVYESQIYDNGKRLVYIDRINIPQDIISKHLLKNYKYDATVYENEKRYEDEVVPAVIAKVEAELGKAAAHSTRVQYELTGERLSPVDIALSEHYDEYVMAKRLATKDLYVASNAQFLANNIDNEDDIIYQGKYTSSFILYATDEEIEKYAKCSDVELILPFVDYEVINEPTTVRTLNSRGATANSNFSVPEEHIQIGVDSISGTKSTLYNSGNGYKGTGVKVGIIELKNGAYDAAAPQLSSIHQSTLFYLGNADENDETINTDEDQPEHATVVTSLIVGQGYTVNGCTYEGVVPCATVYQIGVSSYELLGEAISILIDNNVSVINYSAGVKSESYWYDIDGEIDEIIENTGVSFVKSAGNTSGYITCPGKAYNAITVGNLWTKDYIQEYTDGSSSWVYLPDEYENNFIIAPSSSYQEASYLANKPDVVAPGCGINCVLEPNTVSYNNGTSFATPLVTGIVAQLHQAKPFLRINPTATKALIIAGASHDLINEPDEFNDTPISECTYLRNKTGAGLVNAKKSIDAALSNQYATFEFNVGNGVTDMPDIDPCGEFSVPAGKKVRFVMTFNKITQDAVPETGWVDNVDFAIYNNNTDALIAWSSAVYNNVEIVEFDVNQATPFYVVASLPNFLPRTNGKFIPFSFAYYLSD